MVVVRDREAMKHATIDAGVILASFISNAKEAGLHTTACTFDISQFFPSLDHRVTALILTRLGFDDRLVALLGSYFRDRTTFYRWDSATSKPFDFSVGTPQGDCISPVLSALYLAIALRASVPIPFPPPNVRSLFFVDDGLLYTASKSLKQNASRIERKLQEIITTLARIGLYIEADKTEVIHFPGYILAGSGRRHAELSDKPSLTVNDGNRILVVKPKDCGRKGKKVTFPFEVPLEAPSGRLDDVHDDWEQGEDKPDDGPITPIEYIDRVIASHAPSHMKDKSTKEKAKHVEDEVSRLKQRLEDFRALNERTRQSDKADQPERVASPVVIDLVTPEVHQAGSPEVASL